QTWKFQDGCDILKQYCDFIEIVREYAVPGNPDSYKQAIEEAISRNILKEYLIKNSTEVINMFLAEYDYETDIAVQREEAREEGREEGRETGRDEKAVEAAVVMIKDFDIPSEIAAQKMGAPLDKVLEALKKK
ncbi:MAG: hypothetical protein KBT02_13250, partial [Treponema sp.]|nr:hypothetical protein [Candidatus Treponema caballi]